MFAVVKPRQHMQSCTHTSAGQSDTAMSTKQFFDAVDPITSKLDSIDKKIEKTQLFLLKGSDTVYKDIALFANDIFKCPICFATTKDKVPHATSCCNHIFCLGCINELVARQNTQCSSL